MTRHLLIIVILFNIFTISNANCSYYTGPTSLSNVEDENDITIIGPAKLKKVQTSYLNITGPLEFSDLKVATYANILGPILNSRDGVFKQLVLVGPIDAEHIRADEMIVTGPVNVKNLDISGEMSVIGPTKISDARLQNLNVTSNDIILENVQINNITVKEDKEQSPKVQNLVLKGKNIINGDINFISGKGIITIDGASTKILGKIIGASKKESS